MKPAYFKSTPTFKVVISGYLFIVLIAALPFLCVLIAGATGDAMGCNINEAGTDECVRMGIHFGSLLSGLVVMGWLALLSIPAGGIAFIVWTIMGIHAAIYYAESNSNGNKFN